MKPLVLLLVLLAGALAAHPSTGDRLLAADVTARTVFAANAADRLESPMPYAVCALLVLLVAALAMVQMLLPRTDHE